MNAKLTYIISFGVSQSAHLSRQLVVPTSQLTCHVSFPITSKAHLNSAKKLLFVIGPTNAFSTYRFTLADTKGRQRNTFAVRATSSSSSTVKLCLCACGVMKVMKAVMASIGCSVSILGRAVERSTSSKIVSKTSLSLAMSMRSKELPDEG